MVESDSMVDFDSNPDPFTDGAESNSELTPTPTPTPMPSRQV